MAAIHTRTVGGSNTTHYLHRDHLGSPELITDSSGNALVRPSFAAYGERRDGADWDGAISSADLNTLAGITRRGFTGHEHLDAVELIHMNGRVYEPVIGRFLGVDPIRMLGISQDANPYAYAWNDPLNVTDPSGWCDEPERWTIYQSDDAPGGITDIVVTGSHVCPNKASSVSIASSVIVVGGSFGGAGTGAGVGGGRGGGSGGDEADDPAENASEPQSQEQQPSEVPATQPSDRQVCLRETYGATYDYAWYISPLSITSLVFNEVTEYLEDGLSRQANRAKYTGGRQAQMTAARQLRTLAQFRAFNAATLVAGVGAIFFIGTANLYCVTVGS